MSLWKIVYFEELPFEKYVLRTIDFSKLIFEEFIYNRFYWFHQSYYYKNDRNYNIHKNIHTSNIFSRACLMWVKWSGERCVRMDTTWSKFCGVVFCRASSNARGTTRDGSQRPTWPTTQSHWLLPEVINNVLLIRAQFYQFRYIIRRLYYNNVECVKYLPSIMSIHIARSVPSSLLNETVATFRRDLTASQFCSAVAKKQILLSKLPIDSHNLCKTNNQLNDLLGQFALFPAIAFKRLILQGAKIWDQGTSNSHNAWAIISTASIDWFPIPCSFYKQ